MDAFWTVAIVFVTLWALGLIGGSGGSLIDILVVISTIVGVYRLYAGRNVIMGKQEIDSEEMRPRR